MCIVNGLVMHNCVVGVIALERTFESDHSNRTAGNTGSITNEQKVCATCLAAIGDPVTACESSRRKKKNADGCVQVV